MSGTLPTVGAVWVNRHTRDLTTVTELTTLTEFGVKEFAVEHTCAVPPGFKRGHPAGLASFLEHWQPQAETYCRADFTWDGEAGTWHSQCELPIGHEGPHAIPDVSGGESQ